MRPCSLQSNILKTTWRKNARSFGRRAALVQENSQKTCKRTKGLTFISTHQFLHHAGDLCVAKAFQLLHLLSCEGMFPHGRVHGWAEEQRFAQIPGADDTSLQEKPRGLALGRAVSPHSFSSLCCTEVLSQPACQPKASICQCSWNIIQINSSPADLPCIIFQHSSSVMGKNEEGGYKEDRSHPTPAWGHHWSKPSWNTPRANC